MSAKIWTLIRKYCARNRKEIKEAKPIIELPYAALGKHAAMMQNNVSELVKEARIKCGELGYEIDSIIFFAAFDGPIIFNQTKITSRSDDYFAVYMREDESCFAVLFNGSFIEAK